jgi:hypothetical protein
MRPVNLVCGFFAVIQSTAIWAQTEDPRDLLLRVRAHVTDTVHRLPKYMCSLTVERAQYLPDPNHAPSCDAMSAQWTKGELNPRLYQTDRVRLDVGIAAANEIYSWVGEDRFDDRDVFDLVSQGALQTGGFTGFLTSIFGGEAANFTYNGETVSNGRTLAEFGFQVPQEQSNYWFTNRHGKRITTGYEGEFLADPKTGELMRLVIRTNGDLSETGACESITALDYSRVRLNDSEFLLPREANLDILNSDGTEFHNRTGYAACHEFRGESQLRFDAPAPNANSAPAKASPLSLPFGLPFKVVFTEPINTETAAAGDRIQARLASPIRDDSSKVTLVPKGAEVTVRIGRLESYPGPPASIKLIVKLETVKVGGTLVPLTAAWAAEPLPRVTTRSASGLRRRIPLGSFSSLLNSSLGVFEFKNAKPNFVIKSGLESDWTTAKP